ncbi:hypothetical protein [Geminicoccus harenae]|nr:hypothetical protein [Geminicoccus harenae]
MSRNDPLPVTGTPEDALPLTRHCRACLAGPAPDQVAGGCRRDQGDAAE